MKNKKAPTAGTRQSFDQNNFATGKNRSFDARNHNKYSHRNQCRTPSCRSDYLKFSESGYCQLCLQKIEFIRREHPALINRAKANFKQAK